MMADLSLVPPRAQFVDQAAQLLQLNILARQLLACPRALLRDLALVKLPLTVSFGPRL